MELFMSILLLLGGVGVFLAGMKTMSSGLSHSTGGGIKRLFKKISTNRIAGYGVGIGATAIVQSSSATTVMTIGLANAGIIDTRQGSSIILGAKVGTTFTAFIFALSGLNKGGFSTGIVFASLAFVGSVILMVTENDRIKNIATFLLGFGMLFLGLEVMGISIGGAESSLGQYIATLFTYDAFKNPLLLMLVGIIFTFVIQSSTAATAIFITFLATGMLSSVDQSFFLVLGANIGTCSDGIMASLGGSADGKRIAMFHLLTSISGALFFSLITIIFRTPVVSFFTSVIVRPEWSLAIYNLIYNVIYTLLLLPLLDPLVKLMQIMIKDNSKKNAEEHTALKYINNQIMRAPVLALSSVKREILQMGKLASENLEISLNALINGDTTAANQVFETEKTIDLLKCEISRYLIKLTSVLNTSAQETKIGAYHHVINDIERIGDHAKNFMTSAVAMVENNERFTSETCGELFAMHEKVQRSLLLAYDVFDSRDTRKIKEISETEEEIDTMHKENSQKHFKRLREQSGVAEMQIYYDVISELERVGDHAVNIATSVLSPIGNNKH